MRSQVLLAAAALVGLAAPVFAQDRTLPAGAYELSQPTPYANPADGNFIGTQPFEGRSVGISAPAVPHAVHHKHK